MLYVDLPGRLALAMKGDDERKILSGKLLASGLLIGWISIAMNGAYDSIMTLVSGAILINGSVLLQRHVFSFCSSSLVSKNHLGDARKITSPTKYVIVVYQLLFVAAVTWLLVLTVYTVWGQTP